MRTDVSGSQSINGRIVASGSRRPDAVSAHEVTVESVFVDARLPAHVALERVPDAVAAHVDRVYDVIVKGHPAMPTETRPRHDEAAASGSETTGSRILVSGTDDQFALDSHVDERRRR